MNGSSVVRANAASAFRPCTGYARYRRATETAPAWYSARCHVGIAMSPCCGTARRGRLKRRPRPTLPGKPSSRPRRRWPHRIHQPAPPSARPPQAPLWRLRPQHRLRRRHTRKFGARWYRLRLHPPAPTIQSCRPALIARCLSSYQK